MPEIEKEESSFKFTPIQNLNTMKKSKTLLEFTSLKDALHQFPITFADIEKTYAAVFLKKSQDFEIILEVFRDPKILPIATLFSILVVINFNEKTFPSKTEIIDETLFQIQTIYKLLVHKLVEKELHCFSIPLFLGAIVMHHLIKSEVFDRNSDNLELLNYCVELIHYKINGFRLNSNTLARNIELSFGKYYQLKSKSHSVMNISIPKSKPQELENNPQLKKTSALSFEDKPFLNSKKNMLEIKMGELKSNYEDIVEDFVKLMRNYIDNKNLKGDLQKSIPEIEEVQQKENVHRKSGININGLGIAMQKTTLSTKKNFVISFLIRLFGFKKRDSSE